jgi:hypothetical protein
MAVANGMGAYPLVASAGVPRVAHSQCDEQEIARGRLRWACPVPRQHFWIGEQIFKHRRISSAGKSDQYRKVGQVMWRSKVSSRRWKASKERDAT